MIGRVRRRPDRASRGGQIVLDVARSERARRALDLMIAVPAATLSAPLVAALAWRIRRESPGGALFRQVRCGRDGQLFQIFKLRTMVKDAERIGARLAVLEGDPRITPTGALLRRYSLDELPNLWNVLRGEMAIVGPRPTLPGQVALYTARQRRRLEVPPGITGWAQVNGRTSLPWSRRIELDIWYVDHRSLWLDLRILARTVRMVATGRGLYRSDLAGGVDLGGGSVDPGSSGLSARQAAPAASRPAAGGR